ncbi:T9SS C-terminal target domain-containing protein [candidate division KSB1 bacterium]|nr:T9SS type A sorting domain-containing protein [candidate division KSB1 bacterium]RQW06341.1 MAG: T9SS C-terminal target domain-containing protein [candidate division KSB1 bacterium]
MSKKHIVHVIVALLLPIVIFSQAPPPEDINAGINKGLEFLTGQQNEDGSWGVFHTVEDPDGKQHLASERVALTGFALTKLCERAYELQYNSPYEPDYIYSEHVIRGYEFLLNLADTYGEGRGIFIYETPDPDYRHHETYNAAVALMAIAASGTPEHIIASPNPLVNGKRVIELLYEMIAYFAWSQNKTLNPDNSPHPCFGGWNYEPGYEVPNDRSDNSITGFVVLALRYAESIGVEIPPALKDRLSVWIDFIQNDENGGSGYTDPNDPEQGQNLLRTGNLLFQLAFLGHGIESPRVQHALEFIGNNWNVTDNESLGWWNNLLAMYCLKQGFESYDLDVIKVDGIGRPWHDDFAAFLLERQMEDGSWHDLLWGAELPNVVSTAWALLILERKGSPPTNILTTDRLASSQQEFELLQNYPNPFNPETQITFHIKEKGGVFLAVYNVRGQLVRILAEGQHAAGVYSVIWNGLDEHANLLPSGLYIYKLTVNDYVSIRKMTFMK